MTTTPKRLACPHCGSSKLVADAAVRWNPEKGEWLLSTIHDDGFCMACEREFSIYDVETRAAPGANQGGDHADVPR